MPLWFRQQPRRSSSSRRRMGSSSPRTLFYLLLLLLFVCASTQSHRTPTPNVKNLTPNSRPPRKTTRAQLPRVVFCKASCCCRPRFQVRAICNDVPPLSCSWCRNSPRVLHSARRDFQQKNSYDLVHPRFISQVYLENNRTFSFISRDLRLPVCRYSEKGKESK